MLEKATQEGLDHIISWINNGKAFRVHDPKAFAEKVMPEFFNQTKFRSFQRQLHIYDFDRIRDRALSEDGAYFHPLFLQGQESLCVNMARKKIKGTGLSNSERQALAAAKVSAKARESMTGENYNYHRNYGAISRETEGPRTAFQTMNARNSNPMLCGTRRVSMSEEEWAQKTFALVDSIYSVLEYESLDTDFAPLMMMEKRYPLHHGTSHSYAAREGGMPVNMSRRGSLLHDGDEVTFGDKKFHFTSTHYGFS